MTPTTTPKQSPVLGLRGTVLLVQRHGFAMPKNRTCEPPIVADGHRAFIEMKGSAIRAWAGPGGVLYDMNGNDSKQGSDLRL